MPPLARLSRRSFHFGLLAVFVLAGFWRAVMAAVLPAIARDGVTFCWYARDLGEQGLAYLRTPAAQQHPLFPVLLLAAQRTAHALGAPDTPLTWQRSGQVVCWLAGMAVIGLVGALAVRLVRRLALPLDERLTALVAMALAAVLDLNVWLSSDVMSDEVQLAFYLAAVLLLLRLDTLRAALGCGVLSGLAFLTREEGFIPALAGLFTLLRYRGQVRWRPLAARAAVLLLGFLICAGPYWAAVGRFSSKKDVFESLRQATGKGDILLFQEKQNVPFFGLAKLETADVAWYALLPHALYMLLRAGRVLIPLLAVPPLVNLRKRLLDPVLCGLTTCAAGHFALTLILLERYHYLSTRHMLPVVMLLTPLSALLLARGLRLLLDVGRRWTAGLLLAACLLPSAWYALRVPNAQDRFLVDAAHWLATRDPQVATQRLLCGSSARRIAFYAGLRWEPWAEQPESYAALSKQIRDGGPGYFAIEAGPGFERDGNRELVEKLLHDTRLAPYIGPVHVRPGPDAKSELRLIELHPARIP